MLFHFSQFMSCSQYLPERKLPVVISFSVLTSAIYVTCGSQKYQQVEDALPQIWCWNEVPPCQWFCGHFHSVCQRESVCVCVHIRDRTSVSVFFSDPLLIKYQFSCQCYIHQIPVSAAHTCPWELTPSILIIPSNACSPQPTLSFHRVKTALT